MIGQTITILPGVTYDDNGDPVDVEGDAREVAGCAIAPRYAGAIGEIDTRGRQGVVIGFTVYAPPGTRIDRTERVKVPGSDDVFEVDGEPGVWTNPFDNIERGVEIAIKRGEG